MLLPFLSLGQQPGVAIQLVPYTCVLSRQNVPSGQDKANTGHAVQIKI